ncbi:MAG TPA: hypothetical protein VGG48_04460 [Rhizomicrobium sp.]|jgi:hypothetical protein
MSSSGAAPDAENDDPMHLITVLLLVLYFVLLYGSLVMIQIALWTGYDSTGKSYAIQFGWLGNYGVSVDAWYLFQVLSVGALGSFIHAATSLADYVGNREASNSWVVWFFLRPFIGSALALVFYLALRGGLLSGTTSATSLNVYGFAGLSAVSGMFSKQATDKLREVFDTLFRTKAGDGDDARKDSLAPTQAPPGGS